MSHDRGSASPWPTEKTAAPQVEAARNEVLAARAALSEQVIGLEGAARAAVDIPARVRQAPAKAAGVAAGGAFIALGGPRRAFRSVRRVIFGPEADLPKSMLPDEVEKELRKLGGDGQRVRAVLEKGFAKYLDEKAGFRKERDLVGALAFLGGNLLKPASVQAGKRLAERLFNPDATTLDDGIRKARERAERAAAEAKQWARRATDEARETADSSRAATGPSRGAADRPRAAADGAPPADTTFRSGT